MLKGMKCGDQKKKFLFKTLKLSSCEVNNQKKKNEKRNKKSKKMS